MPSFLPLHTRAPRGSTGSKATPRAAKKPRTSAAADPVPEDAEQEGTIVLANSCMGPVQFHRAATKMRNLLKYRASEDCQKADMLTHTWTYIYTSYAD